MRYLILSVVLCATVSASADPLCERLYSQRYCEEQDRALNDRLRDARRAADEAFKDAQQRIDLERHDLNQWSIDRLDRRPPPAPPPLLR